MVSSVTGVAGVLMAAGLWTGYPVFGDQGLRASRPLKPGGQVETVIDKGLILELIVACRPGTAIISYSKAEKLYCGPKVACRASLDDTIASTCHR